jgi:hypothetical protein
MDKSEIPHENSTPENLSVQKKGSCSELPNAVGFKPHPLATLTRYRDVISADNRFSGMFVQTFSPSSE